jgi:hypothetical protein
MERSTMVEGIKKTLKEDCFEQPLEFMRTFIDQAEETLQMESYFLEQ